MSRARPRALGLWGAALLASSWLTLGTPSGRVLDTAAGAALRWTGSPRTDRAVALTTDLGSVYAVAGASAVLRLLGRHRAAADLLGVGAAAWVAGQGIKLATGRRRPFEADGVRRLVRPPTGSSFPSGHAAVAAAMGGVLAGAGRTRRARWLAGALGAYVAASRVYVGVHYPSDVLAGAGVGLLTAAVWRRARRRLTP